jgi:hypothetical protein
MATQLVSWLHHVKLWDGYAANVTATNGKLQFVTAQGLSAWGARYVQTGMSTP